MEVKELLVPKRNPLAGVPSLTSRVGIYVPSTLHDEPAARAIVNYQREKVAESLARYFGGYTEVQGNGGWYSEQTGKLIREPVTIVYAGCEPETLNRCLPALVKLAAEVGRAMRQESVVLEIDGTLYLVPPAKG